MNVGELKQILNKYDDNIEVLSVTKNHYNGHGGTEQWTSYYTINGLLSERYTSSLRVSNNGHLDVDIPFLRIDIGGEYVLPIPPHISKQLEDGGEKLYKNITLTKLHE